MKNAVALVSGGLDSATALAVALDQGYRVTALSFDYGQRHSCELDAARAVCAEQRVAQRVATLDPALFARSALLGTSDVPKDGEDADNIPATYVPARNTVFLSMALALAETTEADDIFIGVSAVDYSGYPDCRPEYLIAFTQMANLATKRAVEGQRVQVRAPLLSLSKAETISLGLSLGVNYALTHSCYDPRLGLSCGRCDSCRLRLDAFAALGQKDPVAYV